MKGKHTWVSTGLCLGVVLGLLTDNLALWLCIGVALGAAMDRKAAKKNSNDNKEISNDNNV